MCKEDIKKEGDGENNLKILFGWGACSVLACLALNGLKILHSWTSFPINKLRGRNKYVMKNTLMEMFRNEVQ